MKALIFISATLLTLAASAKTIIEEYEARSLTLARSLRDLNKIKTNTLDLKKLQSSCEAELTHNILPVNCYFFNEKLESLNLISRSDYEFTINTFDNQCLSSVPKTISEEMLPNSYPRAMSLSCIEVIKSQKNKLRYIYLEKKLPNLGSSVNQ